MQFPNIIDIGETHINTLKSYIHKSNCKKTLNKKLNAFDLDWKINSPETLKVLCIKIIAENWESYPIYDKIEFPEDQNLLLEILDINISLEKLCAHIKDDIFWKRAYNYKWKPINNISKKSWIKIYLEKYCSEIIEQLQPCDYDIENITNFIELCSPYVECLQIKKLQPSLTDNNDHIPFNIILSNLVELKVIDLTYDVKDIGINFYLGCSQITKNDIKQLVAGLEKCNELREFRLSSTKMEPFMLKLLGRALEKCSNIESIDLRHCRIGDLGLVAFLDSLSRDSFTNLTDISLINNFLSQEGILELSQALKKLKNIKSLDLRLNPMTSGVAAIISIIPYLPIQNLNLACCSIDETVEVMLLKLLKTNRTISILNMSTNKLGDDLGKKIVSTLGLFTTRIKSFDLRNTGLTNRTMYMIDAIVIKNKDKKF